MNRRTFLKRVLQLSAAGALVGGGSLGYATQIEPEWVTLEQVTVPIARLPDSLEGFKIAQLSDIHLYPFTQPEQVEAAVQLINSRQPDLVALTGDYVYDSAESIFPLAQILAGLNPRYGVFSVIGNHDIWTDVRVVQEGLNRQGLTVLRNKGLRLGVGKAQLHLAGIDDVWSGRPSLKQAMAQAQESAPTILLAHEPDFADRTARDERIALQISGHSHGGQVRLPGKGALILPRYGRKYDIGLNRVGNLWVYTNRGLGVINPPVRFNCPPEVTEFTLVRA